MQNSIRLNVTASQFPFLSDQEGPTVIIPNNDIYYVRPNQFTGETADKNLGIPQFLFIENCMPTSFGMSSVGFTNATSAFPDGALQGDQLVYIRSRTGRRYLMNFNRQNGKAHIYSPEVSAWIYTFQIATPNSHAYVAQVQGRCFIAFKNWGTMWEFNDFIVATSTFEFVAYTGFTGISDLTPIYGIVSANNYLILFTQNLIFYTIPEDVYGSVPDFTPSLGPTGAASEAPSILKGIILTCLPTNDGFYIFTDYNISVAYYSGNIRFPWSYRELDNSESIISLDTIATDRDGYPKYAYTTGGLLQIGKSACTPKFVEAAEFIGNNTYEYFDWPSKEIIRRVTLTPLNVGLTYIAGRWLVISYGAEGEIFTHAIIWDEHLKRWGKIQRNHARAVEFFGIPATLPSTAGKTYQDLLDLGWTYQDLLDMNLTYYDLGGVTFGGNPDVALEYKSLGFMTADGVVQIVNFDNSSITDESVAILGRFQLSRSARSDILSIWSENLNQNPSTEKTKIAVLATDDSKNVEKTEYGLEIINGAGGVKKFQYWKSEGLNHYFRFEGDFDLSTIVVTMMKTGHAYI